MRSSRDLLNSIRDLVTRSGLATQTLSKPVSIYRRGIQLFGPEKRTLTITDDIEATFKIESLEEIRHFYPVYSEVTNLELLVNDIKSDDVFYDVGAHIGIYTCIVGQILDSSQIHAFEPIPKNIERLKENAELNGITPSTHQVALSNQSGTKEFGIYSDEVGTIGHANASLQNDQITVEFVEGGTLVNREGLTHPTVLKIDVEGAELDVLRGLEGALDNCRLIYCEVSPDALPEYGANESELLDWFYKHGFEITPLGHEGRGHYDIRATRPN